MWKQLDIEEEIGKIIAAFWKHGTEVFGSNNKFIEWLFTYNNYWGRQPIDIIDKDDGGHQKVDDQLHRIEYGIF